MLFKNKIEFLRLNSNTIKVYNWNFMIYFLCRWVDLAAVNLAGSIGLAAVSLAGSVGLAHMLVFASRIGGAQSRPSYWLRAQLWEELCSKSAVPIGQHKISGPLNGLGSVLGQCCNNKQSTSRGTRPYISRWPNPEIRIAALVLVQ